MKETIQTAAESFLPALWTMSRAMYDHPELGLEEVNSSRMLREWLAEQGFKVEENFHGLPTAFRAVYGSGRPVLGFLCEYDALPEVGHGCGHDLIGVVSAGAAAVLRQTVDAVGGTLIVYGMPDEEVTCTKVQLTDEGAFDELDVALMLHPYQKTCGRMGSIGIYPVQYEFFGKKCHANEAGPGSDLKGDMDVAEAMIKHIIRTVMEKCPDEINFFNSFVDKGLKERLEHVASSDFGRVSYTEAVELLKQNNDKFDYKVEWGTDLQTEHERYLTEQIFKKPVFVTDYPKDIKAFYMRLNDDGKTVAACDCLVPGIGEIIGGSQREERLELLEGRIQELGMRPEDYWWYLDLRRYGGCKHAGFGLGFERMVMYLTGISNIRDVLPHPRTVGNAEF